MNGPIWRRALALAEEVRVLRRRNRALVRENMQLLAALRLANDTTDKARERLAQVTRDAECLALMAKDRHTALAFLRDAHAIDGLEEAS